jgi:RNA polymerase primary sigma factor
VAGLSEDKVRAVKTSVHETVSLFTPIGEDGATLLDFIDESEDVAEAATSTLYGAELTPMLEPLSPQAREIILRRFGFYDGRRHTLKEISQDYGVTHERVRQIEQRALTMMRRGVEGPESQLENSA